MLPLGPRFLCHPVLSAPGRELSRGWRSSALLGNPGKPKASQGDDPGGRGIATSHKAIVEPDGVHPTVGERGPQPTGVAARPLGKPGDHQDLRL